MTFAQRRNRLTTHFSERIAVVRWRMTCILTELSTASIQSPYTDNSIRKSYRQNDRTTSTTTTVNHLFIHWHVNCAAEWPIAVQRTTNETADCLEAWVSQQPVQRN